MTARAFRLAQAFQSPADPIPAPVPQRARRGRPESQIQKQIVRALRDAGLMPIKIHNEGKRDPRAMQLLKAEGFTPGAPDLVVAANGRTVWLEVKAPRGTVSDTQDEAHAMLRRLGHTVAVVRSVDEALSAVGLAR